MRFIRLLKVFCVFLTLSIGACAVARMLGLYGGSDRLFSHKLHIDEEDMDCGDCHSRFEESDEAGMPAFKKCMTCHEGIDEERPDEKKLAALYGEEPRWTTVTAISDEVIFSHKTHHDAEVGCAECHAGIEQSEGITGEVRVGKDACAACHARKGIGKDCSICHREIRRDKPPASHLKNWKRIHGDIVRGGGKEAPENRCSLCHAESACTACHQDEAPRNHTHFWRIQGHAVSAGVDRGRCATCHRSDFCDRCHRSTSPRNHIGSWGGTQNRHCYYCHYPVSANRPCFTCHIRASHVTAPSRPADAQHAAATADQCRTCHTTIGLPHVDNGDACVNCH